MVGYTPTYIKAYETGLVQSRQNFILPEDAYPTLENAFVWRERIKRKQGYDLLGRLQRAILGLPLLGTTDAFGVFTGNLFSLLSLETTSSIVLGSFIISVNGVPVFTEPTIPNGTLSNGIGGTGTINYSTGVVVITTSPPVAFTNVHIITLQYYPGLPVMGLRTREINSINNEQMVAFDQKYAYIYNNGFQEFIPGTTWTGSDSNFFWSTNYWNTPAPANNKLFWVTNFSGTTGDPIRFTDGSAWVDFAPQIDSSVNLLNQCLCLLPFRGRLVAFNTLEGTTLLNSAPYTNRIRWAQIGNPITTTDLILFPLPGDVSPNAWRDDIRGKGGFLDIPTSEDIISVGFVRDNLVIYCERSTWQLRYTGRTIAPFVIEKVNSELGAESTFSAVQFDTSLVGVGDKGIVECDSFKSERIDIKIPDLIYQFNNDNNGTKRVHGIRDFVQRLAFWTYPDKDNVNAVFPDKRLVYNYENDSWAIFTDSLTTLGTFQPMNSRRWIDYAELVAANIWSAQNYSWVNRPSLIPAIVGGNQQGFVEFLDENVTNDVSLYITNIIGNTTTPTVINSINHNLQDDSEYNDGQIIQISGIPTGTPFDNLNGGIFQITRIDSDNFSISKYDPATQQFSDPQLDIPQTYIGGGLISVRDNFSIISKKFNYLEQGKQYQLGYIDLLMNDTEKGEITMNIYNDYNDNDTSNTLPMNASDDTFFNSTIPTYADNVTGIGIDGGSKNMKRVFCATNSNFITIEYTLSNLQMTTEAQSSDVQIDSQIIWSRLGGRMGITQ